MLIMHATVCAAERALSAWKRLYKAKRAATTLGYFKERIMVAEYFNGH